MILFSISIFTELLAIFSGLRICTHLRTTTLQMSSYFMTLFLWTFYRSHWGQFFKKFFETFENLKIHIFNFNSKESLWKKIEKILKNDFFPKNHTFSTWIWILYVLCFFWGRVLLISESPRPHLCSKLALFDMSLQAL